MKSDKPVTGLTVLAKPEGAMKPDRIATGLLLATALRLSEMYRPEAERIIEDDFGRSFLTPLFRGFLLPGMRHGLIALVEKRGPGAMGMLLCRTRYNDDALRVALGEGIEQVVNMGVGFDTRAYRIPGIDRTRVFELDQPAPLGWKAARLEQVLGAPPSHVTFVPIDFDRQDLGEELEGAGFRTGVKTFFIWEGVTQYITAEAVDGTLRYISRVAGAGSKIAFTYLRQGILDGSDRSEMDQKFFSIAEDGGAPWVFGFDPAEVEGYLAERGFALIEDIDASVYRARFLESIGRGHMDIYDGERMVLAQVIGTS
jgi:methyltransferase (TIGR00027 family)